MMAATGPNRNAGKLLVVSSDGHIQDLDRSEIALQFSPGDLVIANDAATIPGSLHGQHERTGAPIEIRLAGFVAVRDPTRYIAVAFGGGDYQTPTESRPQPPTFTSGDRLRLGPLIAVVERLLDHPRLVQIKFCGDALHVRAGIARHGRPIQYAHVSGDLALWDVWTNIAAEPFAFEAPSAGFALNWQTLSVWKRRGIRFETLTHAAGISSTGDPKLDARLPLDEPYIIPVPTAAAIAETRSKGGAVIAIGTTVARALESAAKRDGSVRAGRGIAHNRIGPETDLQVIDTILTGVHEPGESHFELLRAFTTDAVLQRIHHVATKRHYRTHEFGDSILIEGHAKRGSRPERSPARNGRVSFGIGHEVVHGILQPTIGQGHHLGATGMAASHSSIPLG